MYLHQNTIFENVMSKTRKLFTKTCLHWTGVKRHVNDDINTDEKYHMQNK